MHPSPPPGIVYTFFCRTTPSPDTFWVGTNDGECGMWSPDRLQYVSLTGCAYDPVRAICPFVPMVEASVSVPNFVYHGLSSAPLPLLFVLFVISSILFYHSFPFFIPMYFQATIDSSARCYGGILVASKQGIVRRFQASCV
jgi:hypothetical protein